MSANQNENMNDDNQENPHKDILDAHEDGGQQTTDNTVDSDPADDSLEAQLAKTEAKATENWDHYLRSQAEMDNLRRRSVKDVENAHKFGTEKFVNELLPVMDSMAMGLAVEDASAESLREGMVLTMSMLEKMMEKLGIAEVDPINEKFDAEKHQAMSMVPNADVEPNTVIAVMQKGYTLNDRLIRPAMVMVSKAVE